MKNKKKCFNFILGISLLILIGLTSCTIGKGLHKYNYKDYLTIKYPRDCVLDSKESNGNKTNSFVLNEENFVIISEEQLQNVDQNTLTMDTLKGISKIYAEPFLKEGFQLDSEEEIKVGKNDAYRIIYNVENHTIGYIFWFQKDANPPTLYKIMFVYDAEHKDTVMQMIDSVEIPYK